KYRERGYIFARAGEPKADIVEGPRGWLIGFRKTEQQYYITIPIQENEQYTVESFEIEGVTQFDQELIRRSFSVTPVDIVNYTQLKESTDNLKELYATLGYLDMDAFPDINPDMEKRTVSIRINVTEGRRYIVNRINFAGNTKTRDKVLRREFALEEQQEFNQKLLDYSILRLNQLGFFDKIEEQDYEIQKKPDVSEVDITVKVKERSQQSIGLTGGVSGISGSVCGMNYRSNSLRGMGERIDVQLLTGPRTANYVLSYTQPYFLDSRMSLGLSGFNQRFRYD